MKRQRIKGNILLGIDQGVRKTGFCILESVNGNFRLLEAGILEFSSIGPKALKRNGLDRREVINENLKVLNDFLKGAFGRYSVISSVCIEYIVPYGIPGKDSSSSILHQATGLIKATSWNYGVEVLEFRAQDTKRKLVGKTTASKQSVKKYVLGVVDLAGKSLEKYDNKLGDIFHITDSISFCLVKK